MITYAVGDIHGMYMILKVALRKIEEDSTDQVSRVIFLGDYVDRGPNSKQVIDVLMAGPKNKNQEWICLMGNHDFYFADAVLRNNNWSQYIGLGSLPTLGKYSYNVVDGTNLQTPMTDETIIKHAKWIDTLPYRYEDEYRHYVHAGFMPGVPIEEQAVSTMIWIREQFYYANYDFGKTVVHGHTPTNGQPEVGKRRINIDTGACFGQALTVAKFVDNEPPVFWPFTPRI